LSWAASLACALVVSFMINPVVRLGGADIRV
jgi:hypothetical protein